MVYHMIEFNRFCDISCLAIPGTYAPYVTPDMTNVVHCHLPTLPTQRKEQGEEGEGKRVKNKITTKSTQVGQTRVLMY
jgi:hypothetical protein